MTKIKIGNKFVGNGYPSYIIFEVASTHANNWDIAKGYVKQAKEAGADALKFQLFRADKLLNPISSILLPTYNYFKTAETPRKWFPKLLKLCDKECIDLLCTPFDEDSANYLNKVGLPAIKIASGDLTNHQFLSHVAKFGKPVILSTGMASIDEVEKAVKVLENSGCNQYAILQCTSVYPMPYEAANLKAMKTLENKFNSMVGFSDNGSKGIVAPLVASALGASIIEKHVTSQKDRGNMDDVFSASLEEFAEMAKEIRNLEKNLKGSLSILKKKYQKNVDKLLGDGMKKPAKVEKTERHWARRGVYLKQDIAKGTKITREMLILLRPDVGISATNYYDILGCKTAENLKAKHPLLLKDNQVTMFRKSDIHSTYDSEDKEFAQILSETALFE